MARPELGTKRVCPTTGRKFYDLNRDPIVSPYTGEILARAAFEPASAVAPRSSASEEDDSQEDHDPVAGPETVSLEDAAAEQESPGADDADLGEEDSGPVDDDAFLEEEEEGGDVSDLIDSDIEDDEES
ncbi:TIGR02300 family protein [Enterovirga sp.]|uniref:TIGR02300 family protein n=1 Tax=Enterovirga sp. TaxID=2026350 RepID=UPI002B7ECB07|nr:TIGR02300 family protein [Enterovirga sp.]HMO30357.1 TIGR02300 family protein [Enterovirga sp.]